MGILGPWRWPLSCPACRLGLLQAIALPVIRAPGTAWPPAPRWPSRRSRGRCSPSWPHSGYLRHSERFGDEFSGWLAVAAVFATAAHVSYAFYPAAYHRGSR